MIKQNEPPKAHWIVYRTTNILNGKFYVGVHKLKSKFSSDSYIGSGTYLRKAIAKHGRVCFSFEVVYMTDSEDSAYELEELIVDSEFVKRNDTYNVAVGGRGMRYKKQININPAHLCKLRSKKTQAHRNAISAARLGKPTSEKHKLAVSKGKTGKPLAQSVYDSISFKLTGKVTKIVTCPHCGKTGRPTGAMAQWHFHNCNKKGDL